ncbi:signal peptidase II [Candidatus Uhrbacteria bacterium]|nr:signal peptidase II [Candidatus Uhrbacteria bacterium]
MRNTGIIFFTTFFFDQGIKAIARTYPTRWEGTFFRITENRGIAFSIPIPRALFWILFIVAIFFFMRLARTSMRMHNTKNLFFLGLILGGGFSNALDRFRFGAVTDIFALPGGLLFNIADIAIVIGLFFLFLLCPVTKHH